MVGAADKAAQDLARPTPHTDGTLRTQLRRLTAVNREFLHRCTVAGVAFVTGPSTKRIGRIRTLSIRLRAEIFRNLRVAAHSTEPAHLKVFHATTATMSGILDVVLDGIRCSGGGGR